MKLKWNNAISNIIVLYKISMILYNKTKIDKLSQCFKIIINTLIRWQ